MSAHSYPCRGNRFTTDAAPGCRRQQGDLKESEASGGARFTHLPARSGAMLAPAPPAAFAQLRLGQALAPAQLRYSYRALRQNLPKPPYRSRRARRRAAQLEPPSREGESGSSEAYGLVDLVALSVASTVGSGVFSLAGRVASQEAGPAVPLLSQHFRAPMP